MSDTLPNTKKHFMRLTEKMSEAEIEQILNDPIITPQEIIAGYTFDFSKNFVVGINVGMRPDLAEPMSQKDYQKYILLHYLLDDYIISEFTRQDIGFLVQNNLQRVQMLGVFSKEHQEDFIDIYIRPILRHLNKKYGAELIVGTGLPAFSEKGIKNAYETAHYAFDLYFFEQKQILDLQKIHRDFTLGLDDYDGYVNDAIHAILTKTPDVLERIDKVVDVTAQIHYGNWNAVRMRVMNYTGVLSDRLRRYHLLNRDFIEMQNELQEKVLTSMTLGEIRRCIHEHYLTLLTEVYKNTHPTTKALVERVKSYIDDHYAEDLSVRDLSEIACVSPNYFSHMFKNETGVNYKTYLTNIRLEAAMQLLMDSDYRLIEICDKVGYKNVRTFVDAFKQKYGASPINYKKAILAGEESFNSSNL